MIARGTFEVRMTSEPPFDVVDGVALARATIDKTFAGALEATGKVTFLSARTKVESSAGYAAIERIDGTLDGRRGTFVVVHAGLMNRGTQSLAITIVPDSGTGQLVGIAGRMDIEIEGGQHYYAIEYEIGGA
jgi:hypothetical protein